jgi:glycosyltransferase involved in cell wall biosynthesis
VRILHLTPELPFAPGGSGGSTRQFALLSRLSAAGHQVDVVAPVARAQASRLDVLRAAGIVVHPVFRPRWRVLEATEAFARHPALIGRGFREPVIAWEVDILWSALRAQALSALQKRAPDVVSVEHDGAAGWRRDVPADIPTVMTLQNISWHYYRRRSQAARGLSRMALSFEAGRFRRHVMQRLRTYQSVVTVSERDRAELQQELGIPSTVIPNGVDTSELTPSEESSDPPTIIFTGTLDHPPNSEGIRWFTNRVWITVVEGSPGARLLIVGRSPPRRVRALSTHAGVEVIGPVSEIAPWLGRAHIAVAPLLSGGGTRLKILEAFAAARPVVTTSVGAEGLDLVPGTHAIVAETPEDFAHGILELLGNPQRRRELAQAGRTLVEQRYDWDQLAEGFERVLASAVSRR